MDEQNNNGVEHYPLDDSAIELFAEGRKQIDAINAQMQGAFRLYLRQHKLQGEWKLSDNGKELDRLTAPMRSAD